MALFKQRFIFLLLVSFLNPSIAAVDDATAPSCGFYNDVDKKEGEEESEEEEPDCE